METTQLDHTTLYFREAGSDKVYQAAIEPKGDKFIVTFAFGRRGATLKPGVKTTEPVTLDQAKKVYAALVQSKTSKGYTPGEDGTPFVQTGQESRRTGLFPQLLNFIGEEEVERYINDPAYGAQEKHDGECLILDLASTGATGTNKKGLQRGLAATLDRLPLTGFTFHGESIGDDLFVFDLLTSEGKDIRGESFQQRYDRLTNLFLPRHLIMVPVAFTAQAKRELYDRLKREGKEGIVFKRLDAPSTPGRPASGGDWVKFKFYATASVRVRNVNQKRSVELEVLDGGEWIGVGNVTIPPNKEVPRVGDIVEVRYLYAFRGGSLFQTTYLGQRNDVDAEECLSLQLKYKGESYAIGA